VTIVWEKWLSQKHGGEAMCSESLTAQLFNLSEHMASPHVFVKAIFPKL
jgi:hypothetical protein